MKKLIWIILGASLLIGIILFFCLRQGTPDFFAEPSIPTLEPEQGIAPNQDPYNPSENGASGAADPDGFPPETGVTGVSDPAETEPKIPIDWNHDPSETKQNTGEKPHTSETPTGPGEEDDPPVESQPSQTEPDEETQNQEETGGQIVIPILPPDIFS